MPTCSVFNIETEDKSIIHRTSQTPRFGLKSNLNFIIRRTSKVHDLYLSSTSFATKTKNPTDIRVRSGPQEEVEGHRRLLKSAVDKGDADWLEILRSLHAALIPNSCIAHQHRQS